jgi:lipopolysaccharide transport system ATP-binding protein
MGAVREWPNSMDCPGGDIVRLLAVRVRRTGGQITHVVDVRDPVRVEMEYKVLKAGYRLLPSFQFRNEIGELVFCTHDIDPAWQNRCRPAGQYVTRVEIPGNLLTEGTMVVAVGCETVDPGIFQFYETDVVAFQVVDNLGPDSARGNYGGHIAGVVRPRLPWQTQAVETE